MTLIHTRPAAGSSGADTGGNAAAAQPTGQRAEWADVAKGACIILVVLWHVVVKHYLRIDWHLDVPLPGVWGKLGEQLLPLRMPLFFTISGVFAANALARPWRVAARSRIAFFLYLYALWLLIHTTVFAAAPGLPTDRATSLSGLLEQLTVTPSNLWYLYALALYFTFAKAVRRIPWPVVLAAAAILSMVTAAGLLATPGNRGGLYQNLVFFLGGLYLKPYVQRWAATATNRRLLLTFVGYAGAATAMAVAGAEQWFGVWLLVSILAVAFGVTAAVRATRWRRVAEPLSALGRQTLPIYLIHMPLLAVVDRFLVGPLSELGTAGQFVVAVEYPIVLTAVLLVVCLAVHHGLTAIHANWLFALPGRRRGAASARPTGPDRTGEPDSDKGVPMAPRPDDPDPTLVLPRPVGPAGPVTVPPTSADVEAAARWLSGQVVRTPVLHSPALDRLVGARVLVKAENLQTGGSYKLRGALLAVGRIAAAGGHTGVVAQSTGNHAVAVAIAARRYGLAATVVLPVDAAPGKIARAEEAGARVVLVGTTVEQRTAVARRISDSTGHPVIDAYDHPDVIAGQGSASRELIEEAERAGTPLDALVLPVGGGGGAAGACLAAAGRPIEVYGVEPVGNDSLARSLAAGRRVSVTPAPTLADGLRPSCVGELPFGILRTALSEVVRVDDDAIADAFRLILLHLKVLAEPSGAASLAGALRIGATGAHRTIGIVLTGGNAEPDVVARLTTERLREVTEAGGRAA
ncbi:pyridoxal-phosphate dependent enzyme [Plantactinospora sonchi]|uniref:Pyridoxal-phosphate dependent enzyme n=1 Tax=Plantactinospora sonchi TaxID=1544735 RepID=A0ABU7RUP1_9ACTN